MSAEKVFDQLVKNGLTIAFAESMTGGKACYEMIKIPGASKVVLGGMIVYQKELKTRWLDLDELLIEEEGIVSQAVARQMARNIKDKAQSSIGIGITGNAGPTLQDNLARFIAWISIYYENKFEDIEIIFEDLTREESIQVTVDSVYERLLEILKYNASLN